MPDREPTESADECPPSLKPAMIAYAQSEKVKSGLIWVCQLADQVAAVDGPGRQEGLRLLKTLARNIADETILAGRISGDRRWNEICRKIDRALVMINSGVPQETGFHLAQALALVTRLGGQAAAVLSASGLL